MRNAVNQLWHGFREKYVSVPHVSTLTSTGKITPEEFVDAGESLITFCPNWTWGTISGPVIDPDLPADKQYLINRRVICQNRANNMGKVMEQESAVDGFDGWVQSGESAAEVAVDLDAEDEAVDLDDINIDSIVPDDVQEPVQTYRTYDIIVTYDRVYNSPHVFLHGCRSDGTPLTFEEMSEDVSASHINETVTFEPCKFIGQRCLAIHPCKHAHMMLSLIKRLEHPDEFVAPGYFFIFMKLIHTVIPTIDISTPEVEL